MAALTASFHSRIYFCLLLALSFCLVPACGKRRAKEADMAKYKRVQSENKKLRQSLESQESEIAKIKLQILEKEAQIRELEERLNSQQVMLDEAVQEVVRAKAKLRSLESKAEAASEMAEAEIAVKALKVRLAGRGENPEIVKAEQLLEMSVKEFQNENYGGALYLSSQAKGHIKTSQMLHGGKTKLEAVKGEVLFAQPLPLRVLKTSNLRKMPDLKSKILTTLEKGTPLMGYSYKGEWVRVTREDGTVGWIFQTLVGGR